MSHCSEFNSLPPSSFNSVGKIDTHVVFGLAFFSTAVASDSLFGDHAGGAKRATAVSCGGGCGKLKAVLTASGSRAACGIKSGLAYAVASSTTSAATSDWLSCRSHVLLTLCNVLSANFTPLFNEPIDCNSLLDLCLETVGPGWGCVFGRVTALLDGVRAFVLFVVSISSFNLLVALLHVLCLYVAVRVCMRIGKAEQTDCGLERVRVFSTVGGCFWMASNSVLGWPAALFFLIC